MPGFSPFNRDELGLGPNFTATVNAELKVGGLEETVTASGEPPLVDVQNMAQQTTISKTVLDILNSSSA